jgi:preprotein translocase subunit SecE
MAMNREMKRMLQKQGQLDEQGAPKAQRRQPTAPSPREREQRTKPTEFVREVRSELRKVAWPTRPEVVNYSIIVFVAVVILTAFVGVLDYGFGEFVVRLFNDQ